MNESLTQKIRNDFDQIALHDQEGWNHNNHYHPFLLKQLPNKCKTVLDIGCGTGEFARRLAQCADQVIAIDLSPNMIEVAKQRSAQYTNINFQVADVLQWEFPVEQFDAIASIATVHHLSLEKLLPHLKAALKPGGKLIILDLLEPENRQDIFSDFVAIPLNWLLQMSKNRHTQSTPAAAAAMKEHLLTDRYLTLSQARKIYTNSLGKVQVRKHLFWRYSVVWERSVVASQIK